MRHLEVLVEGNHVRGFSSLVEELPPPNRNCPRRRQLREKLQRLREDGAIRGPEWLQGAVADIRRDELRAMAKAAGLPVKSNSKRLTVSELQVPLSWMHEPLSRCVLSLCVCVRVVSVCVPCVCVCVCVCVCIFVCASVYVCVSLLSVSVGFSNFVSIFVYFCLKSDIAFLSPFCLSSASSSMKLSPTMSLILLTTE